MPLDESLIELEIAFRGTPARGELQATAM